MKQLTVRHGRSYLISLACCLLAACGGGGGGDERGGFANISLSATAQSSTEISLTWSEPGGAISFSPYVIARADDNSSARIDSTTSRTYLVAGLSPGTSYCFEIRDPLTGTRASNVACATTQNDPAQDDSTPPSTPSNVLATSVSPFAIDLSWSASSDNIGVVAYNVFRDGTLVASPSSLRFTDDGLAPATNYCYRISAVDRAGNASSQSAQVCATTLTDTTNPSAPTQVSATYSNVGGVASVAVSWAPSSDDSGIGTYTVLRDGAEIGEATETSFSDTSVQADTTYCYTVFATDVFGNSSPTSGEACVRTSWVSRTLGAFDAGSVALALDAGDVPQIAYKQRNFNADSLEWRSSLSLIRLGDIVELDVIDDSHAEDYIWGEFSMDMVLDASGNAHIIHQTNPGAMMETLQYIVRSSTQTYRFDLPLSNPPLRNVDLAIDGSGQFHGCIEIAGTLYYGNTLSGAWDFVPLDSLVPGAIGNTCSIATGAGDSVHIAYLDTISNDLRYASNAGGSWSSELVDQQSGTSTNTIYHTAIVTDSAGFAHIAYAHDFAENDMEYATNASGSWVSEKVDDAGTVGYASDIVVDSTDRVYVLYEELADGRPLHLATRDGGAWSSFVLSTSGFGQDLSMSVDSTDALHVVFDSEAGELTYMTNQP